MSSSVHSAIILPGATTKLYCKDGLSPLDVQNIDKVINFGGSMKFINCTPANEYVGTMQALGDMSYMWAHARAGSQ